MISNRVLLVLMAFAPLLAPSRAVASAPMSLPHARLLDRGVASALPVQLRLLDVTLQGSAGDAVSGGNLISGVISFFIPGLGVILWNNQIGKGVVLFLVAVLLDGGLYRALGRGGAIGLVYHLIVAYDAYVNGRFIPNFASGGGGGDVAADAVEARQVTERFAHARPLALASDWH